MMALNKAVLPSSLPEQVRNFVLKHVAFRWDDELLKAAGGFAAVCLTKSGYELVVGDEYAKAADEEQCTAILHEMGHILRGDCLLMAKRKFTHNQCTQWNIAADAGINYGLNEESVHKLNGVWYPNLIEMFENDLPREYLPSTLQIFDAMQAQTKEMECSMDSLSYDNGSDISELRKSHAKALLDARDMLKDVPELQGHITGLNFDLSSAKGRRLIVTEPYPLPLASIILKHINGKSFGTRINQRTFAREGRVEGLRGSALLPRIKILAAIDVSGSCSHLVPRFVGASKWLSKRHSVDLVAFDTELYKYGPDVPVGGGTAFRPVYEHAESKKYDAIIMLSDGCAGDVTPMPNIPLIWVMPKENQLPPTRGGDKIIVMDDV